MDPVGWPLQAKGTAVNDEQARDVPVQSAVAAPLSEPDPQAAPASRTAESVPTSPVPIVVRGWRRIRGEPALLLPLAYLFVSFVGLWANYWFYRGFGLPILEYMQASDYLVAGLRDPAYAVILLGSVLLTLLASAVDIYRRRYPERVSEVTRKWWGRMLLEEHRWMRWEGVGLRPETGIAATVFLGMLWMTFNYVDNKGRYIREGRSGIAVRITLAGDSAPLPGAARLLGSSSAFVFLWWPQARTVEAVPIEGIARLQSLRQRDDAPAAGAAKAAAQAVANPARQEGAAVAPARAAAGR
jgi:hypothetical protein